MVRGDVKQVVGGTGLQTAKLVDQGLTGCPGEECADDIRVDDIREGVASLREPADVIPQGLAGLLLAALEVPGVTRADIRPLEVPNEDPLEVSPVADAVVREEFEPHSNMFPYTNGEVLNDEVVIVHSSSSAGEPKVFEPYSEVRLPSVLGDVGRRLEALWERRFLDAATKGLWPRAIRAGVLVIRSIAMPGVHVLALLDG